MKCLLAVEPKSAEQIKASLQNMKMFSSWQFEICTDARNLIEVSQSRPDVLVLSRELPGESHEKLLVHIQPMFSSSRIILLVGKRGEKATAYSKYARSLGIKNIVTGPIPLTPGDRPYTLPVALLYDCDDGSDSKASRSTLIEDQQPPEEGPDEIEEIVMIPVEHRDLPQTLENVAVVEASREQIVSSDYTDSKEDSSPEPEKKDNIRTISLRRRAVSNSENKKPETSVKQGRVMPEPEIQRKQNDFDIEATESLVSHYLSDISERSFFQRNIAATKGKLIVVASNKGGVGKTSVSLLNAIALARSGVKVCLMDLDIYGPNIATFFKIKKEVPGIELLIKNPFSTALVEDLVVEVMENLYVLPGPRYKILPHFEQGKLGKIVDYLLTKFPLVITDTPPGFWRDKWLKEVFSRADRAIAVLDQSAFSMAEAETYAPEFVLLGVAAENLLLVLNMYDSTGPSAKIIEKTFNKELAVANKKMLPRVIATIPDNRRAYIKGTHEGKLPGVEDSYNQIHLLVKILAELAGYQYQGPQGKQKKNAAEGILKNLFNKLKFGRA